MRVLVAEDMVLFREGLVRVLVEHGHEVVDAVADAPALLNAAAAHRPDIAIIDIRMPPEMESDGARAAAAIRSSLPEVSVMLLSQHI